MFCIIRTTVHTALVLQMKDNPTSTVVCQERTCGFTFHCFIQQSQTGLGMGLKAAWQCCMSAQNCECCCRYGEAGLKSGGMGGPGGDAYGASPFDLFEQFFGGSGELFFLLLTHVD